jgi:hypothetical protein
MLSAPAFADAPVIEVNGDGQYSFVYESAALTAGTQVAFFVIEGLYDAVPEDFEIVNVLYLNQLVAEDGKVASGNFLLNKAGVEGTAFVSFAGSDGPVVAGQIKNADEPPITPPEPSAPLEELIDRSSNVLTAGRGILFTNYDSYTEALADEDITVAELREVILGLELAPKYAPVSILVKTLLDAATRISSDYTGASWAAFTAQMSVITGAWDAIDTYVATIPLGEVIEVIDEAAVEEIVAEEPVIEEAVAEEAIVEEAVVEEAPAPEIFVEALLAGADYEPLTATPVPSWVLEMTAQVQQALALLVPNTVPSGTNPAMTAGIKVVQDVANVAIEVPAGAKAVYEFYGKDIVDTNLINFRISFETDKLASAPVFTSNTALTVGVSSSAHAGSKIEAYVPKDVLGTPVAGAPAYTTFSVTLFAAEGVPAIDLSDGKLLTVEVALADAAGYDIGDTEVLSAIVTHLEIIGEDALGYPTIGGEILGDSVATQVFFFTTRFDLNVDGSVTLLDVELVRRNLGAEKDTDDGLWKKSGVAVADQVLAARADMNGDDTISTEDLTAALAAYEFYVGA